MMSASKRIAYLDSCPSESRKTRIEGLRAKGHKVLLAPDITHWDRQLMRTYLPVELSTNQIDTVVCCGNIAAECINSADIFRDQKVIAFYPRQSLLESYVTPFRGKIVMPHQVNPAYDQLLKEHLAWAGLDESKLPVVYYDFDVPLSDGEFITVCSDTLMFE